MAINKGKARVRRVGKRDPQLLNKVASRLDRSTPAARGLRQVAQRLRQANTKRLRQVMGRRWSPAKHPRAANGRFR